MKRILLAVFLSVAVGSPAGLAADSGLKRSSAVASDDLVLLELFYENANKCRMREDKGGPLTTEEAELACARRETLRNVIVDKEYCWDQSEVEWVKCSVLPVLEIIEQRANGSRPNEWWHGTFVMEQHKAHGCKDTDAAVTYGGSVVNYWEQICAVLRTTELPDMHAVLLQMRCMGESDTGPEFDSQVVLMSHARDPAEMAKADVTSYPVGDDLARCTAE